MFIDQKEYQNVEDIGYTYELRLHSDLGKMYAPKYDILNGNIDDHICDLIPYIHRAMYYAVNDKLCETVVWSIPIAYVTWLKTNKDMILLLFDAYIESYKRETGYDTGLLEEMKVVTSQIMYLVKEKKI